ncbi:uncharacterized protein LOC132856323 [Tachysurus vachellii]|uniref:uncharacterized protein LOC132856323 n=1 Tax=Tachysurus vachellii TaxID=175792 RepID=UPI00296A9362|nr:uncharacterized protein LOC132856323 [Tachysurus vachellii]
MDRCGPNHSECSPKSQDQKGDQHVGQRAGSGVVPFGGVEGVPTAVHQLKSLSKRQSAAPRGSGPASAEAARRLRSWGSQVELAEAEQETGVSLSLALSPDSVRSVSVSGARTAISPDPEEGMLLSASGSEELDVGGDVLSPSVKPNEREQSVTFEELLEVVSRAVGRLNLDWPEEEVSVARSKLDDRFLTSGRRPPARRRLPFFPDLHAEVSRSWKNPFAARVFSPAMSDYSAIIGLESHGYGAMPRVEETLAGYLSPASPAWRRPALPSKPCRTTSALVGKAYTAAGQAGAALHTMAVLQAYQADLLAELDGREELGPQAISELRRATDLALRATKQTARSIGRSMAALVATERHLWLNLTGIKDKDKSFLLDAPVSPLGLFGDAVNTVVDRHQERPVPPRLGLGRPVSVPGPRPVRGEGTLGPLFQPGEPQRSPDARGRRLLGASYSGTPPLLPAPPSLSFRGAVGPVSAPRLCTDLPGLAPASVLFQGTREVCARLLPLSGSLAAWKLLPGVSQWVLDTVERGYRIQFSSRPPGFQGMLPTIVGGHQAVFLQEELCSLLEKGAIEHVPLPEQDSGFYSRYFVVPKKDGGLRPILDLRALNCTLRTYKFKMLTLKVIVSQIRSEDWFVTIDLKDAYFHISILPEHRKFLRFAFGGEAYQYRVLPFGLALSPRTFTKCMDAALAPLRLQGIRVLNYLDDWLILAQSEAMAASHRDAVLAHMRSLGLRLNPGKCVLAPSQRTTFLGVVWDSTTMRAHLSPARVASILAAVKAIRLGRGLSVAEAQRVLGLMSAAANVIPLGLLHMRPFQFWLRGAGFHPRRRPLRVIRVTRRGLRTLLLWKRPRFLALGPILGACHRRRTLSTDASLSGWGAALDGRPAQGLWEGPCLSWHINCLEMRAVFLALKHFLPHLKGCHVLVRTDSTAVVSYINHQGGLRSRPLFRLARQILLWAETRFLSLRAVFIPGRVNREADFLSRQVLRPGEWRLHPHVVERIWRIFGRAEVDLFASEESTHCPLWFSLSHPAPLGLDALVWTWPSLRLYAFPPVALLPQVLARVRHDQVNLLLVAPRWPSRVWFTDLVSLLNGTPWEVPVRRDLLSQAQGAILHPRPEMWKLWVWPLRGTSS